MCADTSKFIAKSPNAVNFGYSHLFKTASDVMYIAILRTSAHSRLACVSSSCRQLNQSRIKAWEKGRNWGIPERSCTKGTCQSRFWLKMINKGNGGCIDRPLAFVDGFFGMFFVESTRPSWGAFSKKSKSNEGNFRDNNRDNPIHLMIRQSILCTRNN